MPKVTVLLTSFNHGKFIGETIDSIINQTFKDFELIIWDDASTDNSWKIIQSYRDKRIKSFKNEINLRPNYGIIKTISEIAQGQYIAIHHSDDVWDVTKLEKQVLFLEEKENYGAVFTNVELINENSLPHENKGHTYSTIFNQENRSRHEWLNYFFYHGNALCHPSVMIRRECYAECGMYRYGFAQLGDFDMWIRLCIKYEIFVMPEKLTQFRLLENEANSSADKPDTRKRSASELFYIYKQYLKIDSLDDILKIFPTLQKIQKTKEYSINFLVATVLLEHTQATANLLGLSILHESLNDIAEAKIIEKCYSFNYISFVKLSARYDIFNSENLRNINDEYKKILESTQEYNYTLLQKFHTFASNIDKSKNYIMYGYGSIGKILFPYIKHNIIAIIDLAIKQDAIDGIPVVSLSNLRDYKNANVIVTPMNDESKILENLKPFNINIVKVEF